MLDKLVDPGAAIERVAFGFAFTEGPIWMPEGYLLFGDLPNNVIRKWHPREGLSIARTRSGYDKHDIPPGPAMGSNGMTLNSWRRLTVCEPGNRRVVRWNEDGTFVVLAESFEGRRLNSPNDLVYRSDGRLYFTDPPHGLLREDEDPEKELPFNGIFGVSRGKIDLLTSEMTRPNGIAFSPDERFLYVANSNPARKSWMRYDAHPDGSISAGHIFLDLTDEPGQAPDGMKVDFCGNLYLTGPGGLWIVSPSGEILGVIRAEKEPSNCTWGDADGRTLYLTAQSEIYRIRMKIPGIRPGAPLPLSA